MPGPSRPGGTGWPGPPGLPGGDAPTISRMTSPLFQRAHREYDLQVFCYWTLKFLGVAGGAVSDATPGGPT